MDEDYWSIDSIFAQSQVGLTGYRRDRKLLTIVTARDHDPATTNQKLDCTFLTDVPNLGHLDGGEEPNVS